MADLEAGTFMKMISAKKMMREREKQTSLQTFSFNRELQREKNILFQAFSG
jgi:hypothetical protein